MPMAWTRIESSSRGLNTTRATESVARLLSSPPPDPVVEPAQEGAFVGTQPRRHLGDLIVSAETMERIKAALARIEFHDVLYTEWDLRAIQPSGDCTAINLYGPPGTGKTMCAEAIAGALGRSIILVDYAELESKYVGDTAKNIVAAFEAARAQGAVLFFDEADTILARRLVDLRQSADYGVNQARSVMLKQLESFKGLVIFATNLAQNYDQAFVRRILAHIEFPLPDLAGRERIWRWMLRPRLPVSGAVDPAVLASWSEELSGGEIFNALENAAMVAVTREHPDRCVTPEDLRRAIETVRKAKREIGTGASRAVTVREVEVPLAEAPADVQEAAGAQTVVEGRAAMTPSAA